MHELEKEVLMNILAHEDYSWTLVQLDLLEELKAGSEPTFLNLNKVRIIKGGDE